MIKTYADRECKQPLEMVEWDNDFTFTLIDGKKETLKHTVGAGETAIAIIYLRNESENRFGITKISFPDSRLRFAVDSAWLEPDAPVKLTISFKVPANPDENGVIKAGKISIEGYYVYTR